MAKQDRSSNEINANTAERVAFIILIFAILMTAILWLLYVVLDGAWQGPQPPQGVSQQEVSTMRLMLDIMQDVLSVLIVYIFGYFFTKAALWVFPRPSADTPVEVLGEHTEKIDEKVSEVVDLLQKWKDHPPTGAGSSMDQQQIAQFNNRVVQLQEALKQLEPEPQQLKAERSQAVTDILEKLLNNDCSIGVLRDTDFNRLASLQLLEPSHLNRLIGHKNIARR